MNHQTNMPRHPAWWRVVIFDLLLVAAWTAMRAAVCVPHAGTIEHFLAFDAPLPFAARPLAPALAWPIAASGWMSGKQAFLLIDALGFLAFLSGVRHALRALVPAPAAFLGSLAIPLMMVPAMFLAADYPPIFFPYDMTSIAFLAWGMGFVLRRRALALAVLLPFATLNRETAVLLAGAWVLLWWDRLPWAQFLKTTAGIGLAFAVPRGLALFFTRHQAAPYGSSLPLTEDGFWIIDGNIGWLAHPSNLALWLALLGFVPILLVVLRRHLPDSSRRLVPLLVFQMAALFFSGKLDEARIYADWIAIAGIMIAPAAVAACGAPVASAPVLGEDPRPALRKWSGMAGKYGSVLVLVAAAAAYSITHVVMTAK